MFMCYSYLWHIKYISDLIDIKIIQLGKKVDHEVMTLLGPLVWILSGYHFSSAHFLLL